MRLTLAALLSAMLSAICANAHADLQFAPCELTGSADHMRARADCATFSVAEDPAKPDGARIDLRVAKIKSLSPTPQRDAVTIINGGPGASSIALYVDLARALTGLLPERDIIVLDQRGTGSSNPLTCPDLERATQQFSKEAITMATDACLAQLAGNPRFYSTSQAVADLDALRAELGYEQLNIYGVSYGTRVALHYLRRYPQRVRSLVIDGVVPPELALGINVAINAQTTLNAVLARCSQREPCRNAFKDSAAQLQALRAELGEQSIAVELAHPLTGAATSVQFGYEHLATNLRLLSYAPETAALIPLLIHETAAGNHTPAAAMALKYIDQLSTSLSFGMHNAVVCTEDIPFIDQATIDWAALRATYLGADQIRALITICERWPAAVIDEDFKTPIRADVPTLVLSGEQDPIPPPQYGTAVAKGLTNSLHVVAPGQGHGVIARGCIPRLVADFVSEPNVDALDASCAQRLTDTPFFLDLLGPAP